MDRMPAKSRARSAGPDNPRGKAARLGCVDSVGFVMVTDFEW